jgi:hypothetical protein
VGALQAERRALRQENERLRTQRDILKKPLGILSEPPPNCTKGKIHHTITDLCAALDVSASGYHAHCHRQAHPGPRAK